MGFRNHELSSCHHEAVEMVIQLPATTIHIGAQLSRVYSVEMAMNRRVLYLLSGFLQDKPYLCEGTIISCLNSMVREIKKFWNGCKKVK